MSISPGFVPGPSGPGEATTDDAILDPFPRKLSRGHVIGARLGPLYIYLVAGAKNVQTVFRNSKSLSSDFLVLQVYKNVIGVPKRDVAIFEADHSGSAPAPLDDTPEEQRIWRRIHHAHSHTLQSSGTLAVLTRVFTREFLDIVNQQPLDEWETVSLDSFFRNRMSTATTIALIGRGPFKANPQMTEDFWEYFSGFMKLFLGMPRFFAPKIFDARTRLTDGCTKHLKSIASKYDSIQAANVDWDEDLGSSVNRMRDQIMKDSGFSVEGRGAMMAGFLLGINGNAVPIGSWILMEAVKDRGLWNSLREEIMTAVVPNTDRTDSFALDLPKLLSLPLLSSVFTETLRLRISTTPTRQLRNDLVVDGYVLKAGNSIMVPSWLAHTDESWSRDGHPAKLFWARRFMGQDDGVGEASKPITSSQPGKFFPFGGGTNMCPGRFYAKQEILTAVAIMIAKFDIEFVKNITHDGKESDRGPEPDSNNAGSGAQLPDRDIVVRLCRRA